MLLICSREVLNVSCNIQGQSEGGFGEDTLPGISWLTKVLLWPYRSL